MEIKLITMTVVHGILFFDPFLNCVILAILYFVTSRTNKSNLGSPRLCYTVVKDRIVHGLSFKMSR